MQLLVKRGIEVSPPVNGMVGDLEPGNSGTNSAKKPVYKLKPFQKDKADSFYKRDMIFGIFQ